MESRTAAIEDVLYQKGASISASLDDTNNHVIDNSIDNDFPSDQEQQQGSNIESHIAPSREFFDSLASMTMTGTAGNNNPEGDLYSASSSKDMSIFDDVNNNRLNLPVINDRFTVRQVPQMIRSLPSDNQVDVETTTSTTTSLPTTISSSTVAPRQGNMNETSTESFNVS